MGSLGHQCRMAPRRRPATCASYHAAGVQPDLEVKAYQLFQVSNFYLLIILLAAVVGTLARCRREPVARPAEVMAAHPAHRPLPTGPTVTMPPATPMSTTNMILHT